MTRHRRDLTLQVACRGSGGEDLHDLTQRFVDEGIAPEVLLNDFGQISGLVPEHHEQTVLDVMDLLAEVCAEREGGPHSGDK